MSCTGGLLRQTLRCSGPRRSLWAPWADGWAVHEPSKLLADVAISVARSGDCAADAAVVSAQLARLGQVASGATVTAKVG